MSPKNNDHITFLVDFILICLICEALWYDLYEVYGVVFKDDKILLFSKELT